VTRDVVKVWYDREGDLLEVTLKDTEGYFRETGHDQVMARVDTQGRVIGFSIISVNSLPDKPIEVVLGR
jgi:uncharacterized protein YuzE